MTGCATTPGTPGGFIKDTFDNDDPCSNNARNIGITAGAIAGAVLGTVVAQKNKVLGTAIGAAVGAGVGALIGSDIDRRRCELSKVAKAHNLDMAVVALKDNGTEASPGNGKDAGLSVSLIDHDTLGKGQFATGSAQLQPEARAYFAEIAAQYSYAAQAAKLTATSTDTDKAAVEALKGKRILLIGHTDDTGSSALNADLSEKRARAVADVFRAAGISDAQLFYQGAGETLPIADNHDEAGRARNRRVEIVDLADQATFDRYLAARRPNVTYYRETTAVADAGTLAAAKSSEAMAVHAARKPASKAPAPKRAPAATSNATAAPPKIVTPASDATPAVAAAAPAITPAAPLATRVTQSRVNFGGQPTTDAQARMELGKLDEAGGFFISSAVAATPIARCDRDRPRASHAVKSLRNDKAIDTSEYMPGLYNTSWTDTVNGNLVALTGVAVLRDGGAPARKPTVLVYEGTGGGKRTPVVRTVSDVNTYRGDKAILYRVFVDTDEVQCLDIVIPHRTPDRATGSWLRYAHDGVGYSAAFNPSMVRIK